MQHITVALDGSGDYTTIQEAIDSVRVHPLEPVVIHIRNGIYHEKITIPDNKPDIRISGESVEGTILTYGDHAHMTDAAGKPFGTFRTATLEVAADDVTVDNLTIINSAGPVGQALAVYVSGDRVSFRAVSMLGYQDTLYASRGRQYFSHCYIEGHVDFIFGSSTAVFDCCTIHSLRKGYITAASTPARLEFGFVFLHCKLTGAAEEASVYLGRPWRPHASTWFIHTWMGAHIKPEGWHNWKNRDNERTARYGEYGSVGPGAQSGQRAGWASALSELEAQSFTVERILRGPDGWLPF